ncbi:MAG: flavin reductase family protein [Actinomycetota bacterium]|nr:flavin reductase family protein [Actinomycetota bacterium]
MVIDPASLERRDLNALINGLVYPRPIAWVSTVGADGSRNLAPFSFFNAFSFQPPTVGIGPGSRQGVNKDSLRNIKETGEFVVNVVNEELARTVNLTSAEFDPEVDEWQVAGIEGASSEIVCPERVAAYPVSFECRVKEIVELGTEEMLSNSLVIGSVLRIHVIDEALDGYRPRLEVLNLVGRMGGPLWCTTRDRFELPRPDSKDPNEMQLEAAPK